MGLDTFARALGADGAWHAAPDEQFNGISLCGGMYSGGEGSASIRGKVYAELVQAATGESLYEERIEPERVAAMARRLRAAVEEAKRTGTRSAETKLASIDERGELRRDEEGRTVQESHYHDVLDVAGVELAPEEAEDLARWFEVCAENGFALEAWV